MFAAASLLVGLSMMLGRGGAAAVGLLGFAFSQHRARRSIRLR